MKVVVIGSGLIGLTTAYFLKRRGHEVIVIDREEGPGRDTSFANGALLTPSMSDPWNAPGCWRVLLASLFQSAAPLQLRWQNLPALTGWGLRFLHNSSVTAYERSKSHNLRLALYSLKTLRSLQEETGIEYGRMARGSLRLFRDPAALEQASAAADKLLKEGLTFRRLSIAQTIELEPSLAPIAPQLAGAIHYVADEIGDAHRFCVALANLAREQGVEFHFRSEVISLEMRSGQAAAVVTARERLGADRYVMAAGSYSTPLLKRVGLSLPVRPAKGYSLTFVDHPSAI